MNIILCLDKHNILCYYLYNSIIYYAKNPPSEETTGVRR